MRQLWLGRKRGLSWGPGCAAEGMTVPLAVKDLRPLRGAFGVLDREPLARHRQMEGAGQEPAFMGRRAALQRCRGLGTNLGPHTMHES
jgi:hypothetical protein